MYQVVVLPPAEALGVVEELRRRHDPAFHRMPAHLPVVPPFDPEPTRLLERFDAIRGVGSFPASFGPAEAERGALSLPLADGADAFAALRRAVTESLVAAPAEPRPEPVRLRVGLFAGDAELELARRALAASAPPRPFTVVALTLLLEDVRGLWHDVRRRTLRV